MILHKLPPFQNVAASVTAVLPALPLGMTILGIVLKRSGTFTNAHLKGIRAKLDGKQILDITGPHLLAQNMYQMLNLTSWLTKHMHGENTGATYAQNANTDAPTSYASNFDLIPFADFNSRTIGGELMGAIDTSIGYGNMNLEIDIGVATNPGLEAWAILAPPKPQADPNRFTIRSLLKTVHAPSAAGEFELPLALGSRSGALIHRLFLHHTKVTKLQTAKDGLWLMQEGEADLLDFIQSIKHRSSQSGLIVYDPSINDNQSESISTVRRDSAPATFAFKATLSGSDTVTAYSSLYSTLDRL